MSPAASKTPSMQPRPSHGSVWRTLLGVTMTLAVACGGYFLWKSFATTTADPVDQTEADEFALIDDEFQGLGKPADEPGLLNASLGEVVSADHQAASGERSTVQTVGFGPSERPESDPPAWLDGTIEIEPTRAQSSQNSGIEDPLPFHRFTRE